jgi:hypothetical protein
MLGRILGFTAVCTMLLLPMALASYVFVIRGLDHSHEVVKAESDEGGVIIGETSYDRGHSHTFTIDAEGTGLTEFSRGHQHIVRRDGDSFVVESNTGDLRARVPDYGSITFYNRDGLEDAPIDVGYEQRSGGFGNAGMSRFLGRTIGARKIEHGYIEGGTLCSAVMKFDDITPSRYSEGLPLEMKLRVFRTFKADIVTPIRGTITLRNPDNQSIESEPITFYAKEYQVDERLIPVELKGSDGSQSRTLNLFDDLLNDKNEVEVVIRCLDRGQYLGLTRSDVYLRPAESTFEWNFAKAYINIWLQMLMIIAFGVMFSTILSGPVSMIATFMLVLLGFCAEMVYETRYYLDRGEAMGGGPIESLIRTARQDSYTVELDIPAVPLKIIKIVDSISVYALDAIVTSLPNLPKMLGTAEYVASGFDIFGGLLMRHTVATFGYVVLAFLIGYFFLKTREIAA